MLLKQRLRIIGESKMHWTTEISPLIKEYELRKSPIIIRVNKFDEEAAKKFNMKIINYIKCHILLVFLII